MIKVAGMVAGDKVEKNSIGRVLTSRNMKDLSERRKHTRCYKVANDINSEGEALLFCDLTLSRSQRTPKV